MIRYYRYIALDDLPARFAEGWRIVAVASDYSVLAVWQGEGEPASSNIPDEKTDNQISGP